MISVFVPAAESNQVIAAAAEGSLGKSDLPGPSAFLFFKVQWDKEKKGRPPLAALWTYAQFFYLSNHPGKIDALLHVEQKA